MHIRWTQPATHDLLQISDYIEKHSSYPIAHRVALEIYDSVAALADFPRRGRTGRKIDTLELVLPDLPYLVVYRFQEESVEILRILHGAQRWP
jgi:toxin ParE1/3/4